MPHSSRAKGGVLVLHFFGRHHNQQKGGAESQPRPAALQTLRRSGFSRQLSSGPYGALIVLPEGTTFHPETDKVLVLSRNGKRKDGTLLLNGSTTPVPLALRAGVRYRLRFIDILANNSIVINAVQDGKPVEWTPIAKDGADLAPGLSVAAPASLTIAPGETYDFTFTPEKSGEVEFKYDLILLDEHVTQVANVTAEVR